ncbi:MAG: signal recognition particle-docking protein FtsY [Bdellovibrionales bacterium]|nr:signal recognition particle-docking protein FtsY [Bdellovibrionales bacterium]
MFGSGASKTWKKKLSTLFSSSEDDFPLESLEELLFEADLPFEVIEGFLKRVSKKKGKEEKIQALIDETCQRASEIYSPQKPIPQPGLILLLGVNGAGKTSTAAKLARYYQEKGEKVMFAAADTFRAGAVDQLQIWADRLRIECVHKDRGGDPAAVVYEAWQKAKREGKLLIADTAGRLHNQMPLMDELQKIYRVLQKEDAELPHEAWLVLDGTTGQNAKFQSEAFSKVVPITGAIITKLDGSAKGGAAFFSALSSGLPVRFLSKGESIENLEPFEAETFARQLFDPSV